MIYYGHTKEDKTTKQVLPKTEWQLLKVHLESVADSAERNAAKFGSAKLGRLIGLAHDLGKYSGAFQDRLSGKVEKVDHSTAGAKILDKHMQKPMQNFGRALAFVVAGHHGGLPDGNRGAPNNLPERLQRDGLPNCEAYKEEISLPPIELADMKNVPCPKNMEMKAFSASFFIRMLYSCLVDADFLDTERFMEAKKARHRPGDITMDLLVSRLDEKLAQIAERAKQNPSVINSSRQQILAECCRRAVEKPNFFTLTVPTGGGKTYSSLAFGLRHAVVHKKDRLIYVIPYTSIIEQNAQVFREALERPHDQQPIVLEHHSNFEYPEIPFDEWDNREKTHRLAAENWDRPLVVTTAVQFFESLFANKGARCRKLHNITNSVIVLDEAQMMPISYMKPCLFALAELVQNYGVTVVFCTATQPKIKELLPGGIQPIEIMSDPQALQTIFKRTTVQYVGKMSDEELADRMSEADQALAIVNTRRHARLLFDKLKTCTDGGVYHLSARMIPIHRTKVLAQFRQDLQNKRLCRVVSTQLIEAGVDVDFSCVYRAAAGVDSIAQAAGRCNREGRLAEGVVTVFLPEKHGMPKSFEASAAMTRSTVRRLADFDGDLLSLGAIEDYFRQLLQFNRDELDQHAIIDMINDGGGELTFPFVQIARSVQLIDSPTVALVVPLDKKVEDIIEKTAHQPLSAIMARQLQAYTVQIYSYELQALEKAGVIRRVGDYLNVLSDMSFYDQQVGLRDANEVMAPQEVFIL